MSNAEKSVTPLVDPFVKNLVRQDIAELTAYLVQPATGMIKLDAMENPYALPPAVQAELGSLLAGAALNRYPAPDAPELQEALRARIGIAPEWSLLLGNGSDELIQILAMALAKPNSTLMSVEPSFVMYKMIAKFCGMNYLGVPLQRDFSLDLPAMLHAIETQQPELIFLAYPNNPTGNLFDTAAIEAILRASRGLVVVDEAYHVFACESFLPRLSEFPNLVVMRTLSKLGLAGLRLGFLVGSPAWISQFDKIRLPYNINVLTQIAATHLLRHGDILDAQATVLLHERDKMHTALAKLPNSTVFASRANFILMQIPQAREVFNALKARGILIKCLDGSHPLLNDSLRITIGSPHENQQLLDALHIILGA